MNGAFSAAWASRAHHHLRVQSRTDGTQHGDEVMTRIIRFSMIGIALATLGTSVTSASAETLWQANHPRRVEVNSRLAVQDFRIGQGVADGRITPLEAQRLHGEDRAIRNEERSMADFNGGHITGAEQRALNQQENAVSRQIGR
jgi:hypothetical protein